MTPCQLSIEAKPRSGGKILEDMSLRCVSNCQDTAFDMEALPEQKKPLDVDVDVDVVGCTDECDLRVGREGEETDATDEYSSSFGNTCSGNEDGSRLSDSEVDSLYGDSNLFDGLDSLFRMGKKKVTPQWRRYITPLAWRGKWIELRMKEMKSQLLKYDRELASYGQSQKLELGQCTLEDCSMKSLPFSGQNCKKEVMKRRKRKKIEDMVDVSSYMSHHSLFSYYENKKSDADGALVDGDPGIQMIAADVNCNDDLYINDACPSVEIRDENSLEHVLWKIETVQSRVRKLKTQIEKVLTENAAKFSSVESLTELVESDVPTSPPRSPVLSPGNVDRMAMGALSTSPRLTADNPESAISSYGEAAPHPDIIECSIAPLSEEVRLDQSYFVDSYPNIANDVIQDQEVKKEPHEFERVSAPRIGKPQKMGKVKEEKMGKVKEEKMVKVKEENVIDVPPSVLVLKPESSQEANMTRENAVLKSSLPSDFHGHPTKRKRGERKAGSGTWNADKPVTQILS